jgi:hypothetical protein
MNGEFWALTLALVALVIGIVARRRERLAGASTRARSFPFWLIPIGIIIGVLPGVLRLSDALRFAGSVTSLMVSLTAIILFCIGPRKA